ncbi:Monothiol glutaredoxin-5 [Nosema granulosis]|uniref:Monothiol glutaredoxin-5 n=1 Tax=Nosema granulosis TaxID=83296 RepID=A0A9P6GZZ9_9MICR|nr:Monothiol glutaredoxin-5 [Nosema granulosis]
MNFSKTKNPYFEIDYSDKLVFYDEDPHFEVDSSFRFIKLTNKTLSDSICEVYGIENLPCILFYGQKIYQNEDYQSRISEIESKKNVILNRRIKDILNSGKIVLFMKGSIEEPYCRFSKRLVEILKTLDVDLDNVVYYDVLMNDEMREQIKETNQWPTFPQLFINREFIGGYDIVCELQETNQLEKLIK